MLLDRRRVKFWQKWVFGAMAVLMALWLVSIPIGRWVGCDNSSGSGTTLDDEIATLQQRVTASPSDLDAQLQLAETLVRRANQQAPDSQGRTDDLRAAAAAYERYVEQLAATKGTKAEKKEARRLQVAALEDLVSVYRMLNDYQLMTSVYGQLTDLRPKNAQYFYDMGRTAILAADLATAQLAFTRFLELAPDSEEAAAVEGWLQENSSGATGP